MRLRRLYCNKPEIMSPLLFNRGLSVILAEIRVPANRLLDTHNLGKTTVAELIDFCLLRGKSATFFLFKHSDRFSDFVFYLEVEAPDGSFVTIARPVDPGSKVALKRSPSAIDDATQLEADQWDHFNLPFERAKLILDGLLALDGLKPWGLRKIVGYLIRAQGDYQDVFQLGKFSGKHIDWKPFVAHLLGMEAAPVVELYEKREQLAETSTRLNTLTQEWGGDDADPSVLDGLISVKRRDIEAKSAVLDSFNFATEDARVTADVVEAMEAAIIRLNDEKYKLSQVVARLEESLQGERIIFRPKDAEALFREAGVSFVEQLKRDYEQLVAFNRAITRERRDALSKQLGDARARISDIDQQLAGLNERRASSLEYLRESESLTKYKELSSDLTRLQSELNLLEAKRAAVSRLVELRREHRTLSEESGHLVTAVEREIEAIGSVETTRFATLRRYFTEIVHEVLGQNAIIAIKLNSQGGLDFAAEFVGDSGTATSGDRGTSYRKLLCIAFDLAMLRSYLDVPFPRFVYHDGALEQLEPRKQENLIGVLRKYAGHGLQPIISVLDSDLPAEIGSSPPAIASDDVILFLHDEGQNGRLFRMPPW